MSLTGQIAMVTGASRGIGRGIALQLGAAGATVYVTGRRPADSGAKLIHNVDDLPTLEGTASEITARGGKGIAVFVDHGEMEEVHALFDRIAKETEGRIDILVNNAYAAVSAIFDSTGTKKFYELEPEFWDLVNNVGLRNHYFCTVYAARLMAKRQSGLIVNVSSRGGLSYLFNVPYGVGKAGLDRLAADAAEELKGDGVTVVSLWPGPVRTQAVDGMLKEDKWKGSQVGAVFAAGESVEFSGRAVVALANDPQKLKKTGRILLAADLGDEYGFVDVDGRKPSNPRQAGPVLSGFGLEGLVQFLPQWVKLPGWALTAIHSKLG